MLCLSVEILMAIVGLYALVTGKLTDKIDLTRRQARIVGLFLIAPIPLAIVVGTTIGFYVGLGVLPESTLSAIGVIEMLLVLGALAGAVIYANVTRRA
jgi:hypothetical protein